jgi:UDP-glucose 4-epimerase
MRPGEVASCFADPAVVLNLIGWQAEFGIERMCANH